MDENSAEKEKKRKKRSRFRRRFAFLFCAFIILFLWVINNHCASKGIPERAVQWLTAPLENAGYKIRAEHMIFSFTDGLHIKNLKYSEMHSGITLSAPTVYIDYHPLKFFTGVFCPVYIRIQDGVGTLPILPETGAEGKNESLHIRKFNTVIQGKQGMIEVLESSAEIGNLSVKMHGSINNLLHILMENIFEEYWEQNKAGEKWKNKKYPYGIMQMFPIEMRERFIKSYHRFEQIKMDKAPECFVYFYIDMNDFDNCRIDSELTLPEFEYENLKIHGLKEQISLENGILELKEVSFDLGNNSSLTVAGTYIDEGEVFSGRMNGKCRITDLIQLIEPELVKEIRQHITFEDEAVSFKGELDHLSISGKRYKGNLDLTLPSIIVDGIVMKNVKLQLFADENRMRGKILHAELDGGEITGTFTINSEGRIFCDLKGKAHLLAFRETFPDETNLFIREKIGFAKKELPIEFSGKFRSDSRKMKRYSGSASIRYPHFTINGVEIQNLNAELEFSPDQLLLSKVSANTKDNALFSGTVKFDMNNKHITAKMVASGKPEKLSKSFDTIWQTNSLSSLAKDISSHDNKGIVETDVELFASYGSKSFYQISGNLVMRNLSYCGIPFLYGAARFITDSDNKLIIPDLILKTKDGSMQLESIYYGADKNFDDGILHFNLKSTLKGNDLLTIFCEDYKPTLVDFPFPVNVNAKGVIHYSDQKKTRIKANIQNGACTFSGARISDIDTVVHLNGEELSFNDAEMTFCEGACKVNFRYDFSTCKGWFQQKLENADLAKVLNEFHFSGFVPAGVGNGNFAISSEGTFDAKDDHDVFIDGKAKLGIYGEELWDIPIMKNFLKYISDIWTILGGHTGITKINADIDFKRDRAVIREVNANGNLISINASGEFCWNTGDYDVTVYAELLKAALPFAMASKILSPLSWILKKNFKGKYTIPSKKQ